MLEAKSASTATPQSNPVQNSLFLKALRKEQINRTPIWFMRQAGRYMPEYRQMRAKVKDFIAMCQDPQMAADVTMLPINRFDLDAAIIFSDILLIGQAMGQELAFVENKGPVFEAIQKEEDIAKLDEHHAAERLSFVFDAIQLAVKALDNTPLIGFCGSPWTVATYMVEGGTSKDFAKIKSFAWRNPNALRSLINKLTQVSLDYLIAQAQAGVQALMIFDTWGGILADDPYRMFSLSPIQTLIQGLRENPITKDIPLIFFGKGKHNLYPELVALGTDALSIDWTVSLGWVRQQTQDKVVLQGNLDPTVLLGSPDYLEAQIAQIIQDMQGGHHIFNLGHGVLPQTDPEQVVRMIQWVKHYSQQG